MFQKRTNYNSDRKLAIVLAAMLCICLAGYAYPQGMNQGTSTDQGSTQQPSSTTDQRQSTASGPTGVAAGQKMEVEGVILKRSGEGFTMLDERGQNINVLMTNNTEVKERKSNPFRRAKNYATTQLLRGLQVEVKGSGDSNGNLVAREVKLKDDDYRIATSVESRVSPVEGRLGEAETRLGQSEQNAQRLSGQVEELTSISNAARGGAKAAQETADKAQETAGKAQDSANQANTGVRVANERISSLDDFDVRTTTTVHFKVGSAVPSKEAKADLDKLADDAKNEKGYVIEVAGFASADGSEALNRRLSQRRADAVIQYLAENHDIPLRRIVTPFGYGEKQPVADNTTRTGRQQNRRVEVKILVNKGLIQSASSDSATQQSSSAQGQR
jgi:outer membrane protein OmpA-like peptidoglycan-associated protein